MGALSLPLFFLLAVMTAPSAHANRMHVACQRLCHEKKECLTKCVNQSELMELSADFIHAVADFTPSEDERMKVLRSGANTETLALCRNTGWSMDNILICLRSYPTHEVINACKKLSPRQEEQVRCIRMGKTTAEIDACILLVPGTDLRLRCLEMDVTAEETRDCHEVGGDSYSRLSCLNKAQSERVGEARSAELQARIEEERSKEQRAPASTRKTKP